MLAIHWTPSFLLTEYGSPSLHQRQPAWVAFPRQTIGYGPLFGMAQVVVSTMNVPTTLASPCYSAANANYTGLATFLADLWT